MKKAIISALLFVFVVVVFLSADGFTFSQDDGTLYRSNTEPVYPNEDPILLVTDSQVVLFFEKNGILNIYDLDGNFQYGFQLVTSPNGIGHIGSDQGLLYIDSRASYMFVIDGDEIVTCLYFPDDHDTYRALEQHTKAEPNRQHDGFTYAITGSEVFRFGENEPLQTIIRFPQSRAMIRTLQHTSDQAKKGRFVFIVLFVTTSAYYLYRKRRIL